MIWTATFLAQAYRKQLYLGMSYQLDERSITRLGSVKSYLERKFLMAHPKDTGLREFVSDFFGLNPPGSARGPRAPDGSADFSPLHARPIRGSGID